MISVHFGYWRTVSLEKGSGVAASWAAGTACAPGSTLPTSARWTFPSTDSDEISRRLRLIPATSSGRVEPMISTKSDRAHVAFATEDKDAEFVAASCH